MLPGVAAKGTSALIRRRARCGWVVGPRRFVTRSPGAPRAARPGAAASTRVPVRAGPRGRVAGYSAAIRSSGQAIGEDMVDSDDQGGTPRRGDQVRTHSGARCGLQRASAPRHRRSRSRPGSSAPSRGRRRSRSGPSTRPARSERDPCGWMETVRVVPPADSGSWRPPCTLFRLGPQAAASGKGPGRHSRSADQQRSRRAVTARPHLVGRPERPGRWWQVTATGSCPQ